MHYLKIEPRSKTGILEKMKKEAKKERHTERTRKHFCFSSKILGSKETKRVEIWKSVMGRPRSLGKWPLPEPSCSCGQKVQSVSPQPSLTQETAKPCICLSLCFYFTWCSINPLTSLFFQVFLEKHKCLIPPPKKLCIYLLNYLFDFYKFILW